MKNTFILTLFLMVATSLPGQETLIDFNKPAEPPLIKKFSQYNAGIINPHNNYDRDLVKLKEVNSHSFRIDLSIGKSNCTGSNPDVVSGTYPNLVYNFSKIDGIAQSLNDLNVLPFWSWCYIPKPLQEGGDWRNLNAGLSNWKEIWQEIHFQYASHYRQAGIRMGYHEIYNEPDLFGVFLNEADFNSYYYQMYEYGVLGIKAGDPDAVVGGPAYAIGEWAGAFINYVTRRNLPLDFLSFHSYLDGSSWPNELNSVRGALNSNVRYQTTGIFLDEFSWYNSDLGPNNATSPMNFYPAAGKTLETFSMLLDKTDILMVNWAQFMESTYGDDSYGLIRKDGHRKAVFNAFKIYADMPEERVKLEISNTNLKGLASCNENKAAVAIWNTSTTAQPVSLVMNNLPFTRGNFKLYRIDQNYASYFDGADENLSAVEATYGQNMNRFAWNGSVAANGVIYITLDDCSGVPEFDPDHSINQPAKDVRTFNYYPKRGASNYAYFDRKTWTAYLGMGTELYEPSFTAVEAFDIPDHLHFNVTESSNIRDIEKNSILGIRLDFRVNGVYLQSVLYHDGLYHADRTEEAPWGTGKAADQVNKLADLKDFTLMINEVGPENWDGRVIISFLLASSGPHSQIRVKLTDPLASSAVQWGYKKPSLKILGCGEVRNIEYGTGFGHTDFRIYNIEGKLLQTITPDDSGFQSFSVSQLPTGVYLLNGSTALGLLSVKFIVN